MAAGSRVVCPHSGTVGGWGPWLVAASPFPEQWARSLSVSEYGPPAGQPAFPPYDADSTCTTPKAQGGGGGDDGGGRGGGGGEGGFPGAGGGVSKLMGRGCGEAVTS